MAPLNSFARLPTEQPNPASRDLDTLSLNRLVSLMNQEDSRAASAVGRARPQIVRAVELIVRSLKRGGRLFFVGAGTSGRLGILEAAECPPTFNTSTDLIQSIMAGGPQAVFRSQEGAEDRAQEAAKAVGKKVRAGDVVVGIAASGVTPFALVALNTAKKRRAKTILVTCNPRSVMKGFADVVIAPQVGPEILTGSTRLKAGTATKMILNMLTTLSMVRLGKVYKHWMVDLQPRSQKLVARGLRLIQHLGGVPESRAKELFALAKGRVKTAILMARTGMDASRAQKKLERHQGFLHKALK